MSLRNRTKSKEKTNIKCGGHQQQYAGKGREKKGKSRKNRVGGHLSFNNALRTTKQKFNQNQDLKADSVQASFSSD